MQHRVVTPPCCPVECCGCAHALREAHTNADIDITCICGSASSAGAVSHSWLGEAPGPLATVYFFLRIREETW